MGLPTSLGDTLSYHHNPTLSENHSKLVTIVHLADAMTQLLKIAPFSWDKDLRLNNQVLKILGFESADKLKEFILEYKDLFKETYDSLVSTD